MMSFDVNFQPNSKILSLIFIEIELWLNKLSHILLGLNKIVTVGIIATKLHSRFLNFKLKFKLRDIHNKT